jgi:uncharacterized membrane protein YsdA (DUF1294 family)/cold shock CspA family protein
MSQSQEKHSGRIIEWDPKKGFGFLHDGTHRIFLHSRDFAEHRKTPERGDTVTFSMGEDFTGRSCAKNAVITGTTGRLTIKHIITLILLLIAPAVAIYRLSAQFDAVLMIVTFAAISFFTFLAYIWDKHQARTGGWRTAEATLHLLELIGGWPGAFLAQRRLRHKSSKVSFLVVFWIIVAVHQLVAIDFSLGWRLSRGVMRWVQQTTASES